SAPEPSSHGAAADGHYRPPGDGGDPVPETDDRKIAASRNDRPASVVECVLPPRYQTGTGGGGAEYRMALPPTDLLECQHRYPPVIQSLTLGIRKVIHEELAPCHEYIFNMRSTLVLVYSATERVMADGVCNITAWKKHVNLGFVRGTDLADPAGLLEGTGKATRHIQLHSLEDLGPREIRRLLRPPPD